MAKRQVTDRWLAEALAIAAKFERENHEFVKAATSAWNDEKQIVLPTRIMRQDVQE